VVELATLLEIQLVSLRSKPPAMIEPQRCLSARYSSARRVVGLATLLEIQLVSLRSKPPAIPGCSTS